MQSADASYSPLVAVFRWLINSIFQILWMISYLIVRLLIIMRRWIPPGMLLLIFVIVPLLGFSLPRLDRAGSYIMVAAAIALAFIAGSLSRRK